MLMLSFFFFSSRKGTQKNARAENQIARTGTLRSLVLPRSARKRKSKGSLGPPSSRVVSPNKLREDT